MNDAETRGFEMFLRVREFGHTHATTFPPTTFAGELLARLGGIITELETQATAQDAGRRSSREGSTSKASARSEVREHLERISRTARTMALILPGLEEKFRLPRKPKDQELLTTARTFLADASPLKAEFTRRGMPANFLEELEADISEFETSINQKIQGTEKHVTATAAIDDAMERGLNTVRELDAIMRNTFADDAGTLAAWLGASRMERAPKRTRQTAQPTV